MRMIQLTLDLPELEGRRDPFTCPHLVRTAYEVKKGEVLCGMSGTETYTNCHASIAGDEPKCVHEPIDNSAEAMERRRAFLRKESE